MLTPLDEIERSSAAILASEDWAAGYSKAPTQHAAMIKNAAKMQRQVMVYLRGLAKNANQLINWHDYSAALFEQQRAIQTSAVQAYDVNVVVNNDAISQQDQTFIKIVFDTVASTIALGADSMETEYGLPIGIDSTSALIQDLTTDQLANLVGMQLDKNTGLIVPNPNPAYNIDQTTRGRINQSIKTSIRLGESHQQAVDRLMEVITDPARADMIAYTETVRAYAEGRRAYADQSNATGKYWSDVGAIDICADNTDQGIIPIGELFVSGDDNEPAHVHCRCITTYVYGVTEIN